MMTGDEVGADVTPGDQTGANVTPGEEWGEVRSGMTTGEGHGYHDKFTGPSTL